MFDGHKLYKIGNSWCFDLTEFVGYKVEQTNGVVKSFEKAFIVKKDTKENTFKFDKKIATPLGVMRKSTVIIDNYLKEALVS